MVGLVKTTLEMGNFPALAKYETEQGQNTQHSAPHEKGEQDNDQRSLPALSQHEVQTHRIGVLDGKSKEKQEQQQPDNPGHYFHGRTNKKGSALRAAQIYHTGQLTGQTAT